MLYFSSKLPQRHAHFNCNLKALLQKNKIQFSYLANTKDIWIRDYMPIINRYNKYTLFRYNPDYLKNSKYKKTISDGEQLSKSINLPIKKSPLILDGGNVIQGNSKILMCDKVFRENRHLKRHEIIKQLEYEFESDQIYFLPTHASDFIGHADGMVHLIDDNTVIINDLKNESKAFSNDFKTILRKAKLQYIELPCTVKSNKTFLDATGIYINFLRLDNFIILGTFNQHEDEITHDILTDAFPNHKLITINASEIAREGGVINCISWEYKNQHSEII